MLSSINLKKIYPVDLSGENFLQQNTILGVTTPIIYPKRVKTGIEILSPINPNV
jgi:hypothetical protein